MNNHPSTCPWDHFEPASLKFCEQELCSWITQPANTWSNLAFIIAGFVIIHQARKLNQKSKGLALIGWTAIFVGVGSFMFHMSGTFMFEVIDQAGMFFISGIMVVFNLNRIKTLPKKYLYLIFTTLTVVSIGANIIWKPLGIPIFGLHLTIFLTTELFLYCRDYGKFRYKYLHFFVVLFILSFTAWTLDVQGILCDPENHLINGHSIWHVLNSFCIFYIYKFYRQFSEEID